MFWAFDARAAFLDRFRGFGRVVRELVPTLLHHDSQNLLVCVPKGAHLPTEWYPFTKRFLKLRRPRRGAWLFDGPAWAWSARRWRFAGLHLPTWGVPPGIPVPVVATFHDATPLLYPEGLTWWQRKRLAQAVVSLKRATVIHAASRFAARQLAALHPSLAQKIVVIPHGVSPRFRPSQAQRGLFVLGVGGGESHKNWELIFEVYSQPQAATLPPLRLVGQAAEHPQVLRKIQQYGLQHRLQLLPRVDDDLLVQSYNQALALVFPSRNEGFGLPALEAMASGCPVLAAAAGALPEVCGDAAILLPPDDPRPWLEALLYLAHQPGLQQQLSEVGIRRAQGFSWPSTASALWDVYRELTRRSSAAKCETSA